MLVGATLLSSAAFGTLVYASLWLQHVLGLSPIQGGLVLVPLPLSSFLVSALVGRFLHGDPARWAIPAGLLAIGAGDLLQARLDVTSHWSALLAGLAVTGVGVGLATPTLASAGMAAVPAQHAGMAAGAVNTARQLGLVLGIAVLGSVYHGHLAAHGPAAALATTFLVAGAAGLAAATVVLALLRAPRVGPAAAGPG